MNEKRILLLGSTGKLGTAINQVFSPTYEIIGLNIDGEVDTAFPTIRKKLEIIVFS